MEDWIKKATDWFNSYYNSFSDLTVLQKKNFEIKKNHSIRVANISLLISEQLKLSTEETKTAFLIGLLHDIGRFKQLIEYNTFNDNISVDHAKLGIETLIEVNPFEILRFHNEEVLIKAISNHNKFKIEQGLNDEELFHTKLIRDADKLDILKVLTDYYSNKNGKANHTLTWELEKGTSVSKEVAKETLEGKLVTRNKIKSEIDVKIMQLSWIYDINFIQSFELLMKNRYLEIIYDTLPKNDLIIEIYRKVKVFAENQRMS